MNLTEEQKFEALKLRYHDQSELAKFMKQTEQKFVFGFLAVQFALVAWFSKQHATFDSIVIYGLVAVNLVTTISIHLLLLDYKRRRNEVISTIVNICKALKFDEPDFYMSGITINPVAPKLRIWAHMYIFIIWLCSLIASATLVSKYF